MNIKTYKSSLIAISTGIILSLIILIIFSVNPQNATIDFLTGNFTSIYYFGSFLNTAALLMFAGVGSIIAISSGNLNLGGEGQIYSGGFVAAIILTKPFPPIIAILLAFLAAIIVGALQTLFSVLLRKFKKTNILLTTFLISAAIIPCVDDLIAGKFRGQTGNLLATAFIPESVQFPQILSPSPLSAIIFFAPLICVITYIIVYKTKTGRTLQIWGKAPEFARYCGYSETKNMFYSLLISGAMHSLTGAIAICSTYYTCHAGFYAGMGWNALSCALIAQSNPLFLIPSSLILSWLYTSASRVSLMQNLPFDISSFIQGIILFCISINYISRKRRT